MSESHAGRHPRADDHEREHERARDSHGGDDSASVAGSRAVGYPRGLVTTVSRVYLAGPLGFSEAGRHFYRSVFVPFVAGLGYEVIDPWAHTDQRKIEAIERLPPGPERLAAWRALNHEIGAANRAAIDRAHGVIAILDGTDVDSGTAAEIGYAFARGKLIVGYRGDFRLSADNEGSTVNLQVEFFIRESGGTIVSRYEDLGPSLRGLRASAP
ncbi:MAG: 2-deoxyribonucleoside glycosidase [Candidatus Rokuibacteriota bacterium]|nr:MAG: 2-deoxyribonucleoside glycosidase [Candidatus Rokubacteria bacterium]